MAQTLTIDRSIDQYSDHDAPAHLWSITADGQRIAELWVDMATGEILNVWTHEDHRGQGHATALYQQASSEIDVYHAPESHRTDDGQRFAERVGGPELPPCKGCCAFLYDTEEEW